MPRPLMQHHVGELEELFGKSKADRKVLQQLEHELQYRKVPRAVALLAEVQAAMYGTTTSNPAVSAPSPAPSPHQPSLWDHPAAPPSATGMPPMVPPPSAAQSRRVDASDVPNPTQPPASSMLLEDAYKLLNAAAGSTWESIEQNRRHLVQQAYPVRLRSMSPDQRVRSLAEAKRVNSAYAALLQARCGGR